MKSEATDKSTKNVDSKKECILLFLLSNSTISLEKFNLKNVKADTADPFVNKLLKKLRNKKKKMDKIHLAEQKAKNKEIVLNEETKEMLSQKEHIQKETKEIEKILGMYKDAFPDNPAFAQGSKKNDNKKIQQEQKAGLNVSES